MIRFSRSALILGIVAALAACVRPPAPQPAEPAPPPATALEAGVTAGPPLHIAPKAAQRLYDVFMVSCPALLKRVDASGLTQPGDWEAVCRPTLFESPETIAIFFEDNFDLVRVGDGNAFATGYYEPQIRGSRVRALGYDVPIHGPPTDLLTANPLTGEKGRGRIDEKGDYVLYHDRAAIESGAIDGKAAVIGWAADPIDLFFLQIQGSGQLILPDGGVMRIGYADQNGREYIAIGRLLKERGLIEGTVSMQRIVDWLRAHPEEGRAIMRENKSYIFFRELTGPGPLGALGVPVTPRATVAADPKFVPLGAPIFLTGMDGPGIDGFWVAQDTGGAIKGANRFDTFWGAGADAAAMAGGLQTRGNAFLLLPKAAADRLLRPAARGS